MDPQPIDFRAGRDGPLLTLSGVAKPLMGTLAAEEAADRGAAAEANRPAAGQLVPARHLVPAT